MSLLNNIRKKSVVIFDHHGSLRVESKSQTLHSYLLRELGNVAVTSQAEFLNPDRSGTLDIFLNQMNKFNIKTYKLYIYLDVYSINAHFKCSQFTACDVIAWIGELNCGLLLARSEM